MTLRELLLERKTALCGRWQEAILAEYGEETAARWRRQRDPFANPFGHALATGLPAILEAVAGEGEPGAPALSAIERIVRIRSVQELAPSRAAGFVLLLRDAVRDELGVELAGGARDAALAAIHARIERLGFVAFDLYVRCREQMLRLRQEELKRSVASVLRRWNGDGVQPASPEVVRLSPPPGRGMVR